MGRILRVGLMMLLVAAAGVGNVWGGVGDNDIGELAVREDTWDQHVQDKDPGESSIKH